jgi:hypothetical protein
MDRLPRPALQLCIKVQLYSQQSQHDSTFTFAFNIEISIDTPMVQRLLRQSRIYLAADDTLALKVHARAIRSN